MSTQINVTVGSGGLSDKARQLQTAARQAQLEKERQQRIETQGQEQRNANLAAAGKGPDGLPLFGPGFKQPEVERRPAANRREAGPAVLIVPSAIPQEYGFTALTRNIKNKTFNINTLDAEENLIIGTAPEYVSSGGPNNAAYLGAGTPNFGQFTPKALSYLFCDNTDVQAFNPALYPAKVVLPSGVTSATPVKKPVNKLAQYTFECYLGTAPEGPVIPDQGSVASTVNCSALLTTNILNFFPGLFDATLFFEDQGSLANRYYLQARGFSFNTLSRVLLPPNSFGTWHHVALVRKNNTEYLYIEGNLLATAISDFSSLTNLTEPAVCNLGLFTFNGGAKTLKPGIHGFRFTPKAIYSGESFAPPANITSLA